MVFSSVWLAEKSVFGQDEAKYIAFCSVVLRYVHVLVGLFDEIVFEIFVQINKFYLT
jgi:hypothetical protein